VDVEGGVFGGSPAITGNMTVASGGAGSVTGASSVSGNVDVYTGGSFAGAHTVTGALTTHGACTISPSDTPGMAMTLTVGNLTLDASTTLNFNLGAPGTTGQHVSDLISITGDLSLDGTLNVNNLSGFGPGVYTIIGYSGLLSGNGLTLGSTLPVGYNYAIDSTSIANKINLDVSLQFLAGDTNRDNELNSLDIDAIYQHLTQAPPSYVGTWPRTILTWSTALAQYDVNNSLSVTQDDVTYELNHYFLTSYGDANMDKATGFVDFQALLNHWQASGPSIGWAQGDFNGDGVVDFLDFQFLLDDWNPSGWVITGADTPEPATLSLLALGGLALLRRSRKKA